MISHINSAVRWGQVSRETLLRPTLILENDINVVGTFSWGRGSARFHSSGDQVSIRSEETGQA